MKDQHLLPVHCTRVGERIYEKGYDKKTNLPYVTQVQFKPTLFLASKNNQETTYRDLYGKWLSPIEFGSISDCNEFLKKYEGVEEFPIYGNTNYVAQHRAHVAIERGSEIEEKGDVTFSVVFIDIETANETGGFPEPDTAREEVLLISSYNTRLRCYDVFCSRALDEEPLKRHILEKYPHFDHKSINVHVSNSERELFKSFIAYWQRVKPDAYTGWNVKYFDIPYLVNRIRAILGEDYALSLSPYKIIKPKKQKINNGTERGYYIIEGVSDLDYLELMRKFTYGDRESWKLDDVAEEELGRKKLEYVGSFKEFYTKNFTEFTLYNIIDIDLVKALDEKLGLIELAYTVALTCGVNVEEVFSPIKTWDTYIYIHLLKQNIVIPHRPKMGFNPSAVTIPGGYVKEPQQGMHKWVVSFDFASLYPHIMMFCNISPETLVSNEGVLQHNVDSLLELRTSGKDLAVLKERNACMAASGECFKRDVTGFVPSMVSSLYTMRAELKSRMLQLQKQNKSSKEVHSINAKQMAIKILMNALYGATASPYFRFFDNRLAESITLTGQLATRWVSGDINDYLNKILKTDKDYVIYSDTDSCYISLDSATEYAIANGALSQNATTEATAKFVERFATTVLQKVINNSTKRLASLLNSAAPDKLVMKVEKVCNSGVFVAKKRYALSVLSSEGVWYKEPEISVTGLEIVRSSTPKVIKDKLKETLSLILNAGEFSAVQDHINNIKNELLQCDVERISFPRTVNGIEKYQVHSSKFSYASGCPIHVRGSLLYNHMVKTLGLENKYTLIKSGDKIKFVYLREPNTIRENVIAFKGAFPEEFSLREYVDRDTMFDRSFKEPLEHIMKSIGWALSDRASLEDLFQ